MKEISKTRRTVGWVLSALGFLPIIASGIAKLSGVEALRASLASINLDYLMPFIGGLELLCVALYLIPKTSNIGFFLLCSYVGGIIAAEMAMGAIPPIIGVVVAIFLYVGTMLRKPQLSGLGI